MIMPPHLLLPWQGNAQHEPAHCLTEPTFAFPRKQVRQFPRHVAQSPDAVQRSRLDTCRDLVAGAAPATWPARYPEVRRTTSPAACAGESRCSSLISETHPCRSIGFDCAGPIVHVIVASSSSHRPDLQKLAKTRTSLKACSRHEDALDLPAVVSSDGSTFPFSAQFFNGIGQKATDKSLPLKVCQRPLLLY